MGYDRGDSFPFDFVPNGISLGSKSRGKLSPRTHNILFERKWKSSFLIALPSTRIVYSAVGTRRHCYAISPRMAHCVPIVPRPPTQYV